MAGHNYYDDPDFDLEAALSEQRDDRASPIVAIAGVIGVIVGLVIWGSLTMSVLSSGDGSPGGSANEDSPAVASDDDDSEAELDCMTITDPAALSPDEQALFNEQCATPEPEPPGEPTPDTRTNRENCNEIRGTDYRSPEERQWFLSNCVTR